MAHVPETDRPTVRRRLASLAAALALLATLSITTTPAASAATSRTVRGTVVCVNGHTVQGVYVESTAGGGKFAATRKFAGKPYAAYFFTTIMTSASQTSVRLNVGCGGSSSRWWSSNYTKAVTVTGARTLNARCWEAAGKATRCKWPPSPAGRGTNPGIAGYCTWGAAQQWRSRATSYPNVIGDAYQWKASASSRGYYVSTVPHARSIVVFQPGVHTSSRVGHVAYVLDVIPLSSGRFNIRVIEMNGTAGFNRWSERTVPHASSGMDYIVQA